MILFLSAADTDLLTLHKAVERLDGALGAVRAANVQHFRTLQQVQDYCGETVSQTRLVILRLLGGKNHFQVGFDTIVSFCLKHNVPLIAVPGDQDVDPDLTAVCSVPLLVVSLPSMCITESSLIEGFRRLR